MATSLSTILLNSQGEIEMKTNSKLLMRTALCSTAFVVSLSGSAVFAQEAAAPEAEAETAEEAIVVTGSRIARPDLESNSPMKVVTGEATTAQGDITLETYLNTLPGINPAGTTTSNNPPNNGQANIDMRGLGPNRNLILIDGRRAMVSASDQTVDVNTIPQPLIERVDVITGGAGAAYGADAVAGVVNFVLKNDYEGIELRGGYANTLPETDAREWQISGTIGGNFADGRGNIVFSYEHAERQGLIKSQRNFSSVATATTSFLPEGLYAPSVNAPSQAAVDAYFAQFGAPAGSVRAGGSLIGFNLDGSLFSRGVFNSSSDVVNFRYPIDSAVNTNLYPDVYSYNFDAINLLVSPLKRDSFFGKAKYEITEGIELFLQGNYTKYSAESALAPTPIPTVNVEHPGGTAAGRNPTRFTSNLLNPLSAITTNQLIVPVTNPFIPAAFRALLATRTGDNAALVGSGANEPFLMRQRTLSAGLRRSVFDNRVYQFMGGLRGEFAPNWNYELSFSEGRTKIVETQTGNIDTQRVQDLLERADGGTGVCAGGLNLFGRHPLSQECVDYLSVDAAVKTVFTQRVIQGFVTGDVVEIPAGTIKAVLGAEQRKFRYSFDPGPVGGPISGFSAQTPEEGGNRFNDIFGELSIPLLDGKPWAQSLELNLGVRHSNAKFKDILGDETGGSSDWTYKAELSYAPIDQLRLRASYQRSVRAPNFEELFDGGSTNPQYFDPCSITSTARTTGPDAARISSLCLTGNTANAVTAGNIRVAPGYVQTPGTQLSLDISGNTDLKPEKGDSFTAGLVVSGLDGGLRRLRASVDYYNIKVSDVIVNGNSIDPNLIVANCYNYFGNNPNYSGDNANCGYIGRAGGDILGFGPNFGDDVVLGVNGGYIKTSGIDFQLGYDVDMPFLGEESNLSFNFMMNYLIEYKQKQLADQPAIDYAGTVAFFGSGLGASQPRFKGLLNTTLKMDDNASLVSRVRYIHGMENRMSRIYLGEESFTGTKAVWYFDFGTQFRFDDRFTLNIGLNNAFDKKPPRYRPNVQSGTDPSLFDVLGRRFYVQAGVKF
jgi:iron complex outermembrane recepter protein